MDMGQGGRKKVEARFQGRFGKWLRYGGGASFRTGKHCLYYKISDSALGFKPFDCFVLGIREGSLLGELGYSACAFELKVCGASGRVAFSVLAEHQIESLLRSLCDGCGAYFVLGFPIGSGFEAFLISIEEIQEYKEGRVRGSFSKVWCKEHADIAIVV